MTNLFNDTTHVSNMNSQHSYTPTNLNNNNSNSNPRSDSIDAKLSAYNNPNTYSNGVKQLKHGINYDHEHDPIESN
jgi:hypothetical protein